MPTPRALRLPAFCFGLGSTLQLFPPGRRHRLEGYLDAVPTLALRRAARSLGYPDAERLHYPPSPSYLRSLLEGEPEAFLRLMEEAGRESERLYREVERLFGLVLFAQLLGFVLAMGSLAGSMYLILHEREWVGLALLWGVLGALVLCYRYGVEHYARVLWENELVVEEGVANLR